MPAHLKQGIPRQSKKRGFTAMGQRVSKPSSRIRSDPRAPAATLTKYN